MDTLATRRVYMLARLAFVWALLIVGRLIQLQIVQHGEYQKLAQQKQDKIGELKSSRGAILATLWACLSFVAAPGHELARGIGVRRSFEGAGPRGSVGYSFEDPGRGRPRFASEF